MEHRIGQFHEGVRDDGMIHLNVHYEHGVLAGSMPGEHRDPFDRLLAAQALIGDFTVITRDPAVASFGCKVFW
jgi:PIN domain nuclease of toxin-antitoxin system